MTRDSEEQEVGEENRGGRDSGPSQNPVSSADKSDHSVGSIPSRCRGLHSSVDAHGFLEPPGEIRRALLQREERRYIFPKSLGSRNHSRQVNQTYLLPLALRSPDLIVNRFPRPFTSDLV